MKDDTFFCHLSSRRIAEIIDKAEGPICYAGPGVQQEPAQAMVKAAIRLGPEMLTIWIDFDERVMRMGYGEIEAVKLLREVGIMVRHAEGLRSALIIADDEGYTFTPTPLYLEAEPNSEIRNALRLSREQVAEALARLSPAAKAVAVALAQDPEEKERISSLPAEGDFIPVDHSIFNQVDISLKEAPPVKFDVVRQVRVFEPYLQYVELSLTGAAIQRHRLAIPASIQKLGGSQEIEGRLRTTFDLIEKGGKLSSKPLEDDLNDIRKNYTPSLGKDHGRVVLKGAKPYLEKRLDEFREKLAKHQKDVKKNLQQSLDESKEQIIEYYLPRVVESPPDALLGQLLSGGKPSKDDARRWLVRELSRVFPEAESLIKKMSLEVRYKDVTFETLNRDDFLDSVKMAFPDVDWDKAYNEFKAAGEGQAEK
ncbi:MAG: hypothetical protein SCH71_16575 [Desulfobulbaceae bacterium]|nr:hypothetical protein [Desulfobulbaceae bacterium]